MKINDPKDGFAGYGRYYKGFEYRSDIYSTEDACLLTDDCWDSYEHWGFPDERFEHLPIVENKENIIPGNSGSTAAVPGQNGMRCGDNFDADTAPKIIWLDRPSRPVLIDDENPKALLTSALQISSIRLCRPNQVEQGS